jgi:phage terminase large subunit-like protein
LIDHESALIAIDFIQSLKLSTDPFYGQPFQLLDWQYETLYDVYGTKKPDGRRQYQFVYLEIPKKNGKTELMAAAGLYHTFFDGVMRGEVYGCAAEKKQAGKAFDAACAMIGQNKYLSKRAKIIPSQKTIIDRETGTTYLVLSAEAYSKHGLIPSAVLFDELHAQPDRRLWDVMTFGSGATRREPIWWVITTAGDDPDHKSVGWEQHEYARKVRDGEIIDPSWYVKIYGAPEDADIWDEKVWYSCNPSLGHTIPIESVRQEALTAHNSAAVEKNFRWLRLNQWVSLKSTSWLALPLWDSTVGRYTKGDLAGGRDGKKYRCYAGLDLSTVNDLTGIALLFPPQEGIELDVQVGIGHDNQPIIEQRPGWYFLLYAFHPEENMKERVAKDHVDYETWRTKGFLEATPGNVIDYDYIQSRIVTLNQQFDIVAWGNDRWGAEKLRQDLLKMEQKDGGPIELLEVPQDVKALSPPMKEIERLIKSGEMQHEKNPLGRWCWGNVTLYVDGNGNIKPLKNKAVERIDPMAALFNAMHLALRLEKISVYDTRPAGEKIICF